MQRRTFIGGAAALVALSAAGAAQAQVSLNEASAYLNRLTTAEARFEQINADGSRASGRVIIHRPGRMRFDYDPPNDVLVLAAGGQVGVFDGRSNQTRAERYPLRQTPLNLILERNVNLANRSMVREVRFDGTTTSVYAQDPNNPEYGYIVIRFRDDPVRLVGWTTVDGAGTRSDIHLTDLRAGGQFSNNLFSIQMEEYRRR